MSDTPTPLQERVAQLCDPYQGEEGANAVRMLADEVGNAEADASECERLHIENLSLRRANERLKNALRGMIVAVEGDRMKNAIQRGKDVL